MPEQNKYENQNQERYHRSSFTLFDFTTVVMKAAQKGFGKSVFFQSHSKFVFNQNTLYNIL